jgi:hypothetical protein
MPDVPADDSETGMGCLGLAIVDNGREPPSGNNLSGDKRMLEQPHLTGHRCSALATPKRATPPVDQDRRYQQECAVLLFPL